jgi:transposase
MDHLSHDQIFGMDVSRDWLDMHCRPDGWRRRLRTTEEGHALHSNLASKLKALACLAGCEEKKSVPWGLLKKPDVNWFELNERRQSI